MFLDDRLVLVIEETTVLVDSMGISVLLRHADEIVVCEAPLLEVVSVGTCIEVDPSRVLIGHLLLWPEGPELESNTLVVCGLDRLRMHLSEVWATSSRVPLVFEPTLSTLSV